MAWLATSLVLLILLLYLCAKLLRYRKINKQIDICPDCLYPEHPGKDPYDVTTPCSECGLPWSIAERRFIRKRRIVCAAALGATSLAGLTGVIGYRDTPFVQWLPDRLLVAYAPLETIDDGTGHHARFIAPLRGEITRRRSNGELSDEHLSIYAQRLVDELADRGELVRTRTQWPHDATVHVQPADRDFFDVLGTVGLRIHTSDGHQVLDYLADLGGPTSPVPDHAIESGVISLDVEVLPVGASSRPLARRRVELPVQFVESWETLLQPVHHDTELFVRDYSMNSTFREGVWTTELWLDGRTWQWPQAALGLRVELLQGDSVLATSEHLAVRRRLGQWPRGASITIAGRVDKIGPLHIRLTPDPKVALRDFDADTYWEGESVVLPAEFWRARN